MTPSSATAADLSVDSIAARRPLESRRRSLATLVYEWSPALLFAYSIGLAELVSTTLENSLGFPPLRFQRLWFVAIPAMTIALARFRDRRFFVPYWRYFFVLIGIFVLLESTLFRLAAYVPDYRFPVRMTWMYAYFLLFINYGVGTAAALRVIRGAISVAVTYCGISLLGYLGIIRTASTSYDLLADITGLRTASEINVSHIGYVASVGIFLVIARRYMSSRTTYEDVLRDCVVIAFMVLMVLLTASRGAFVMTAGLVLAYVPLLWLKAGRQFRVATLATTLLILGFFLPYLNADLKERVYVLERFSEPDFASTGRGIQIAASWENFKSHPLVGVGFSNAASGLHPSISRSNFQYTQLLATGGIFLFGAFIAFYARLLAGGLAFLRHPIVALSAFIAFAQLVSDRVPPFFAVCAYVVFYVVVTDPEETVPRQRTGMSAG